MDIELKRDIAQAIRAIGHEVVDLGEWQQVIYENMTAELANPTEDITSMVEDMITEGAIIVRGYRDVVRFGKLWLRAENFKSPGNRPVERVRARILTLDEYRVNDLYGEGTIEAAKPSAYFVR